MTPDTIIGRANELSAIARFLEQRPAGARGLLIEGDAGIGKTSLWREAVRLSEPQGAVLAARASEAEARLSFTVLGDLLVPVLDEELLGQLAAGQRRALETALLLSETAAPRPDHRAISLAVLSALRTLTRSGPVTIALDDVQWIDAPSGRTLAFSLRRLEVEDVRIVAARRLGTGSAEPLGISQTLPGGLERLTLAPLDVVSLGRVLRQSLDRPFPTPLVEKIHEQTRGNPFFAIEVGRSLGDEVRSLRPGEPLAVPGDLGELLDRRLSRLPADARQAALLLASSPVRAIDVIETAGATESGTRKAIAAGIIARRDSRLEFTHPLLASTVYSSASSDERRHAHAKLAAVAADPEERARHLALATEEASAEVATALEDAAVHALDRGSPLAAAELYELAAVLTPGPPERAVLLRRAAAVNLFDAGDAESARSLLARLLEEIEPGQTRARVLFSLAFMSWNDVQRVSQALDEALDQAGDDPDLRARILGELAWIEFVACRPSAAAERARAALSVSEALADPFPARHALSVLALAETLRGGAGWELIERAVALEVTSVPGESTTPTISQGRMLLWAGDVTAARGVLESVLERFLHEGRAAAALEIVAALAEVEFRAGRWDRASDHASSALEIARDTGRTDVTAGILALSSAIAAAAGDVEQARGDGLAALSFCERHGDRWNGLAARAALGFLELSRGEPRAAYAWLNPAVGIWEEEVRDPGAIPLIPDAVEALVALGDLDEAERLTDRLEQDGRALGRSLARATAARCRGLIAGARGERLSAADHLDRALDEHDDVQQPFEYARTLLVAGETRRRLKQKRVAREFLEQSQARFRELGAPMWAARAQSALARIGGRAPAPDCLTPTESEVAELVARGLTNREVARALFMSPHTVDANLRRIYRKLNIRSRTELARSL